MDFDQKAEGYSDECANWLASKKIIYDTSSKDPFNANLGSIYSRKTFDFLKQYWAEHIFTVPGAGDISITDSYLGILDDWPLQQVDFLCRQQGIDRFIETLVSAWRDLKPQIYFAFSKIKGWHEAVGCYAQKHPYGFTKLIFHLKTDAKVYQAFLRKIGAKTLSTLLTRAYHDIDPQSAA